MSKEKQLFQVQNILDTLIEATDHITSLVKNKELNQSIFMFSTIVEGSQTIIITMQAIDQKFNNDLTRLEQYLTMIAKELEQQNFIKVSEIIQFSLRPHFLKLKQLFIDSVGNQEKDKIISIGVFNSWGNPLKFYPKARVNAMVNESIKQNTILYFFTSQDVDFNKKMINADTYKNNTWERVTVPFPDVINNIGAGKRSQVERKLRRIIPFTSFHVGNKYTLPKRMVKYRKFAELLVPFTVCVNESTTYNFLNKHNRVVFKALGSNRGENIFFVTKKGNRYIILDQKKEQILTSSDFNNWIQDIILKEKGSYIIQRYIHTRTKDDEPYHFRAHVQKEGEGKWQLTHIYPRIGNRKTNLSNISTEGRIEEFSVFLKEQFGEKQGLLYEKDILKLSIEVAMHLDKLYGMSLDELGIDFAIDDSGRIWMHEANNGPQTAFHEEKRAVNTIAYAKYIAKKGIMYTDFRTKNAALKGQFQAKITDNIYKNENNRDYIGILAGEISKDHFTTSLNDLAKSNNMILYQFTPSDIDFDNALIRGYLFKNNDWKPQIFEYPDVIVDRLKSRGKEETAYLYDELEDIPFTNQWVNSVKRSSILGNLHQNQEIKKIIPHFQRVLKPRNVFQFIEKYARVQLKPENMLKDGISIQQTENNNYIVTTNTGLKTYKEIDLRNHIKDLLEKESYIVCEDVRIQSKEIHSAEIHLHLMKNEDDEWSTVTQYVNVLKLADNNKVNVEQLATDKYLECKYKTDCIDKLTNKINDISVKTSSFLEKTSEFPINEIALIVSINKDQVLSLIEINPNGPVTVYDGAALAKSTMILTKSLINNS